MRWSKKDFVDKCNAVLDDIDKGKLSSPAWAWMGVGAIGGLLLSCLKLRKKSSKPIIASMTRIEDKIEETRRRF